MAYLHFLTRQVTTFDAISVHVYNCRAITFLPQVSIFSDSVTPAAVCILKGFKDTLNCFLKSLSISILLTSATQMSPPMIAFEITFQPRPRTLWCTWSELGELNPAAPFGVTWLWTRAEAEALTSHRMCWSCFVNGLWHREADNPSWVKYWKQKIDWRQTLLDERVIHLKYEGDIEIYQSCNPFFWTFGINNTKWDNSTNRDCHSEIAAA
jgi:hypothetical protein